MPTTFRHATHDDVEFIVAVNRLPHVTPAINPVDAERVHARIEEGMPHFIAERAGERLGFVIASVEDDWLLQVHRIAARTPGEGSGSFLLREVLRDEVLEAYEEHANVKSMLGKLAGTDPKDETYNAKLQVLSELVKHHVKEEESEMFKQARELLDKVQLNSLGDEMAKAKSEL